MPFKVALYKYFFVILIWVLFKNMDAQTIYKNDHFSQKELTTLINQLEQNVAIANQDYDKYYTPGKYPFGESINKSSLEKALQSQKELIETLEKPTVICAKVHSRMLHILTFLIEANRGATTSAIHNKSTLAAQSIQLTNKTIGYVSQLLTKASDCYIKPYLKDK